MKNKGLFSLINEISDEFIDNAGAELDRYNEISNSDFIKLTPKKYSYGKQIAAVIVCTFAVLAVTATLAISIGRIDDTPTSSYNETTDPFESEIILSSDSESDYSDSSGQASKSEWDIMKEENPDLFTDDYIDLLKHENTGMTYDNWHYKSGGTDYVKEDFMIYNGGEIEISFTAKGYSASGVREDGFMVFIDGMPQKISVNGKEKSILAVEEIKDGEEKEYVVKFTPVLSEESVRNKDNLTLTFIDMTEPYYAPKGNVEKFKFPMNATAGRIKLQVKCDTETAVFVPFAGFKEYSDIDTEVKPYLNLSFTENVTDIWTGECPTEIKLDIFSQDIAKAPLIRDNKSDMSIVFYGRNVDKYKVVVFKNHEPIKINGADYLEADIKTGTVFKADFTVENVKPGDLIYAIALHDNVINASDGNGGAYKSDSIRLFTEY